MLALFSILMQVVPTPRVTKPKCDTMRRHEDAVWLKKHSINDPMDLLEIDF
jgi:hypothetical protein